MTLTLFKDDNGLGWKCDCGQESSHRWQLTSALYPVWRDFSKHFLDIHHKFAVPPKGLVP